MSTGAVNRKLELLSDSLDDLEASLEPLFAQTLPESLIGLEPLQQAKLQTLIPYLVYDLVFIYLKTRGIDPKTHPVVAELDRVRQYFEKVKQAEQPDKKRTELDKAAANRFIKHAISQVKPNQPLTPGLEVGPSHIRFGDDGASTSAIRLPVKVKSKMLERAQYERQLRDVDDEDEEEEELKMFDDEEMRDGTQEAAHETKMEKKETKKEKKDKGKVKELLDGVAMEPSQPISKRRRPTVDPFAGYGDNVVETHIDNNAPKRHKTGGGGDVVMIPVADLSGHSTGILNQDGTVLILKKERKAAKRAAKAAEAAAG